MIRAKLDIYDGVPATAVPRYTVSEAAHHLHLPAAAVRSWVIQRGEASGNGEKRPGPIILLADTDRRLLSFRNLVEAHVLSALRKVDPVRPAKLRRVVHILRTRLQSQHPLIEETFRADGMELFAEELANIPHVSRGQAITKWLDIYLDRIEREKKGQPIRLFPFTRKSEVGSPRLVAIDPWIAFGKPCIAGTDVPTAMIGERHEAGDSLEELAKDYGRPRVEIAEAIRYEGRAVR